jgi:hypothetical protein
LVLLNECSTISQVRRRLPCVVFMRLAQPLDKILRHFLA